jgi:PAS domain S-box-containing protein
VTEPPDGGTEVMLRHLADIPRASRVISAAIVVFAVGIGTSLMSYVWDWANAISEGAGFEPDEWFAVAAALWLPVVAYMVVRLVQVHRTLAGVTQDALDAFQATVQTVHEWVWQVDADNRITYSNAGVTELLGYQPREVLGRNALDLLIAADDRAAVLRQIADGTTSNGWQHWRTSLRHRDGSVRHVVTSAVPVRDGAGRLVAFRGSTADITGEVVAAEAEQLRLADRSATRDRITQVMSDPACLHMVFQPIVDLPTRRVVGLEALARFTPVPNRPPNVWFDEAWEVGLGPDLELHAVALACRHLDRVPADTYLSVNLSPRTIVDPRLTELLTGLGPDTARIVVELTEHAVVDDYDTVIEVVENLARHGVRLAVDDAGAGYSSMTHVLRLRPHILKIDRSIVADAHRDPARRALLGAVGTFARSVGVVAVAEGVENADELATLAEVGITTVQGYYIARPAADPVPNWAAVIDGYRPAGAGADRSAALAGRDV